MIQIVPLSIVVIILHLVLVIFVVESSRPSAVLLKIPPLLNGLPILLPLQYLFFDEQ